jgi:predicted TIM-barrel fold metal-dependent hydrolase
MDRARVRASLVVLDEEPEEFLRLAEQYPGRLFGLAYYDSLSPRLGLERIRALCHDHPGLILGVTTAMLRFHQDPRLRDFIPLYEYCGGRGLPVQFHAEGDPPDEDAGQPTAFAVLARTYPGLTVICRHTGHWRAQALEHLARFPNLFLLTDALRGAGPAEDGASPSLLDLLHAAGGRKLMFGSGWRGRQAGYLERVEAVRRLPWPARRHIGWRTAVRAYGPRLLASPSRIHPQPPPR